MAELVGKVTEQEKIELIELIEKKDALENLKFLNLDKKTDEKVRTDLENIQPLIRKWWEDTSNKYHWKGKGSNMHWEISFSTGEVYLT